MHHTLRWIVTTLALGLLSPAASSAERLAAAAVPKHDPEGRLHQLNAQIFAAPFAPDLYVERGNLLLDVQEVELALLDFEHAEALAPATGAAVAGRARALYLLGRDVEALACAEHARGLGVHSAEFEWLRGRTLAALGRSAEATAVFRRALAELASPRCEHFLELAELLPEVDALPVLEQGLQVLGPVPGLVSAAVERDLRAGNVDRALARIEALAARAARQTPWLLLRASILAGAGRTAEAAAARAQAGAEVPFVGAPATAAISPAAAALAAATVTMLPAPPVAPDLLAAGSLLGPIVRGPYLQDGTPSSATLRWRTALPTTTTVWLGSTPAAIQPVFSDATPTTEHRVVIGQLPAETRVYYGVGDATGVLAGGDVDHFFVTLPPAGAVRPLRLWALGDSGTATVQARAVRDAYLGFAGTHPADLLLMLGDNAYSSGTDLEYQAAVFDTYPTVLRNTFTWSTLGNHDALSASGTTQTGVYFDVFDLPRNAEAGGLPSGTEAYYSFDRGHVHFVCLDSQDSSRAGNGAMMTWLQADLASTAAPWVVAFFHHPPYTKGTHDSDSTTDSGGRMRDMRQVALPILEAHGVDLVLSGHSHTYERTFLLDGHYGTSSTFAPSMLVDRGDGRVDGDGSYAKVAAGRGVHDGAVYVVAGSSGQAGPGPLNHPAMYLSLSTAGSLVVDVDGNRLDATFVTETGALADHFTIEKNAARLLRRDLPALSVGTGGTQSFSLQAGAAHANDLYVLVGSFGTTPGFDLGAVHVPLNADQWLSTSFGLLNSGAYPNCLGFLDGSGNGNAAFVVPPGVAAALAGVSLYHAYVLLDATGFAAASNAVRVRLLP